MVVDLILYSPIILSSLSFPSFPPTPSFHHPLFNHPQIPDRRLPSLSSLHSPNSQPPPISSILLLPLVTSHVSPSIAFFPIPLLLFVSLWVRLERAKDVVPEHEILPVVRLGEPMVHIVIPHFIQSTTPPGRRHVKPRVIQRRQKPSQNDEHQRGVDMDRDHKPGHQPQGKQMIVLSDQKFNGVDVDGIYVTATWSLLTVVVFVDVFINTPMMQAPMKQRVKQIVRDIE